MQRIFLPSSKAIKDKFLLSKQSKSNSVGPFITTVSKFRQKLKAFLPTYSTLNGISMLFKPVLLKVSLPIVFKESGRLIFFKAMQL